MYWPTAAPASRPIPAPISALVRVLPGSMAPIAAPPSAPMSAPPAVFGLFRTFSAQPTSKLEQATTMIAFLNMALSLW